MASITTDAATTVGTFLTEPSTTAFSLGAARQIANGMTSADIALTTTCRFVSLASVVAAVFAPFYWLFGHGVAWQAGAVSTGCLAVMSLMLIWRHRENLGRIMKGTESKLGQSKK